MITPFKGRSLDIEKPVKVYRNLNNGSLSVMQNGLVVGHADRIMLKDVRFEVRESGRLRVIRESRKNVHAFVVGTITDEVAKMDSSASYNPFKRGTFILNWSKTPLYKAEQCDIYSSGHIFVKGVN